MCKCHVSPAADGTIGEKTLDGVGLVEQWQCAGVCLGLPGGKIFIAGSVESQHHGFQLR